MISHMSNNQKARSELISLLQAKSVFRGDFKLSSGAMSDYYVDCKLTTLDPKGAWLVGELMYELIREAESALGVRVDSVGGLTMGADPISLAIGIFSVLANDGTHGLQTFSVRKTPKSHGKAKLIEGNFKRDDLVVVVDDVITRVSGRSN